MRTPPVHLGQRGRAEPGSLGTEHEREPRRRIGHELGEGFLGGGAEAREGPACLAELGELPRPVGGAGERHPQHVPERHPRGASVEGVGGRRVQHHTVHPEGGRVAEEGADVLVIVHAFDHEQAARAGRELVDRCRRRPVGRGEHPSVEVHAGEPLDLPARQRVHRDVDIRVAGRVRVGDQDRADSVGGLQQRDHREVTLDDEEPLGSLDAHPPRRIAQVPVVAEPRVVEVGDRLDGDPTSMDRAEPGRATVPTGRGRDGDNRGAARGGRETCGPDLVLVGLLCSSRVPNASGSHTSDLWKASLDAHGRLPRVRADRSARDRGAP